MEKARIGLLFFVNNLLLPCPQRNAGIFMERHCLSTLSSVLNDDTG